MEFFFANSKKNILLQNKQNGSKTYYVFPAITSIKREERKNTRCCSTQQGIQIHMLRMLSLYNLPQSCGDMLETV